MRTLFAGLFAIAALFGFSAEAAAQAQTSYYVAPAAATPAGNDSNACTSAAPCLTAPIRAPALEMWFAVSTTTMLSRSRET